MCGIAGWYRRQGRSVADSVILDQCDQILHRGPDDVGTFVDGDFGFGMRRLSILDLAGGHQPITSQDGRYVIVFNGEVVNHLDLRPDLEAKGISFRTTTDTETVLEAWVAWGDEAFPKFEGMYGLAIWDRQTRELLLARDPLGIKPLFVADTDGGIAFGSELKTLFSIPGVDFSVNDQAVHDFFSFGHVRAPRTIYNGVRMLPPGSVTTFKPDGESSTVKFWTPHFGPYETRSEGEWIEGFQDQWLATVKRHLQADVPLGAFLSGGVDSSAILAAMAQLGGDRPKAFTIGFPIERYDETPYAKQVAQHLGCEHIHEVVDLQSVVDILPAIQKCYDEPFADPAAVPGWYLSQMAVQHVKVALSGDGGDEIFAGYRRHFNETAVAKIPRPAWHIVNALSKIRPLPVAKANYLLQRIGRVSAAALLDGPLERFFEKTQITRLEQRDELYDPGFKARISTRWGFDDLARTIFSDADIPDNKLEAFLYADQTEQLPSAMLTKVDRVSMAHSLEVRVPFLSHKLVDWAATMPPEMKLKGSTGKYVVRKAIEPWLPSGVLDRPKQGFDIPLQEWFKGDFSGYAREVWQSSGAAEAGYLRHEAVEKIFDDHHQQRADHGRFLYALCQFSLWYSARPR